MAFDVKRVRAQYPALQGPTVYLDGAAGTQCPESVIDAIADAYRLGTSNGGGAFATSARADDYTRAAREALADLVNGSADGVVLGPNMTTLTYRFARTLADAWKPGDNIVVSRLDHDANVRPWVQMAARVGVVVRWAEVDLETGELATDQYDELVDGRTRLVAVTAASNVLGTRPDVRAITDLARTRGALTYVDGVHSTAHGVTDVVGYGSDFYATSAYKWAGPHVGCVIADAGAARGPSPGQAGVLLGRGPGPVRVGHAVVPELRRCRRRCGPSRRAGRRGGRDPARAGRPFDGVRPRSTTRPCWRTCSRRSAPTSATRCTAVLRGGRRRCTSTARG